MSSKLLRQISSSPRKIFFIEKILPYLTNLSKNEMTSALIIEKNSEDFPKKALVIPDLKDKFHSITKTLIEEGYQINTDIDQKDGSSVYKIYVRW